MDCFAITGSFADIKSLNRPVAINLTSSNEQPRQANWVALTLLNAETALLVTRQSELTIRESMFENWRGEFIVLWRIPPGYLLPISEGSRGATVDWLGAQLSIYDGSPELAPATTFDKTLADRVQSFQKSVNLAPTGIVGPKTWIHLNSVEGIGVPFLIKKQELTLGSED